MRLLPLMFFVALIGLLLTPATARAAEGRPNVLFIFADDWGRHSSSYARLDGPGTINDAIKTPHFDRLASEGMLVRNAFVSAPSCTPCRSALFSGQHFWRTGRGSILRGAIWDFSNPSYMLMLKDAGYHIGKTYKAWGPGSPGDAPAGAPGSAYEKAGRNFNQFSQYVTNAAKKGESIEAAKQKLYDEVAGNFSAFLADRKPGQPFCYWFGPTNTHRKWIRGSGKALWNIDPESLKGKVPAFLPDVPEIREDIADYLGEAQAVDAAIGVLLAKLQEIGEVDNTLVVVSGDHGMPGVTHGKCNLYDFGVRVPLALRWPAAQKKPGRVIDDLVSLTDVAPTILEAAGVKIPDVMTGRSLLSILKSDKAGLVENRAAVFTGRERHVESANEGFLPYPQRAIRTHEYLYIVNFMPDRWPMGNPYDITATSAPDATTLTEDTRITLHDMDGSPTKAWLVVHRNDERWRPYYDLAFAKRPREELYVLADDPHQVRNVAKDPRYEKVRADLEQRLMTTLRDTGDPRVVGNGKFYETPPMAGPLSSDPDAAKGKGKAKNKNKKQASD